MNANPTNPQDILPLDKSNLSTPEIAEGLGISVKAARALVVALPSEAATDSPQREPDNAMLLRAGFEPVEGSDLWQKDDTCFGREAALQIALRG